MNAGVSKGARMEEISELDAARMVTFIYGKELPRCME